MLRDKKIRRLLRKSPGTAVPEGLLERLETNIALTGDKTRQARLPSVVARISRARLPKLAVAAVILLALGVGARMFVGPEEPSGREPTVLAEAAGENDTDLVIGANRRARAEDVQEVVADIDLQLEKLEAMYAANDIDGLVTILSQGSPESQVAAANYLAQMDAGTGALEALEKVNATYVEHHAGADNPFEAALNRMRNRISRPRPSEATAVAVIFGEAGLETDPALLREKALTANEISPGGGLRSEDPAREVADGRPIKAGTGIVSQTVPYSLYQNLVLCYSFYAAQDPNTAVDVSGRGCHGEVHGAVYIQDEVLGGAMLFDGEDDYINIPDIYLEAFTFSAWVRPATGGINNRRIFQLDGGQEFYSVEGNSHGGISVYGAKGISVDEYNWRVAKDTWTHVTVTYDGETINVYRNSGLTETGRHSLTQGIEGEAYIGGIATHNGGFWEGEIDEVALFNRALTAQEVEQLFLMTGEPVEVPEPTEEPEPIGRPEPTEESEPIKTTGVLEATDNTEASAQTEEPVAETTAVIEGTDGLRGSAEPVEEPAIPAVKDELVEVNQTSSDKHTVASGYYWWGPCAADVDGDGDLDVLASTHPDNISGPLSSRTRELSSGLSEISSVADVSGENEEVSDEDQGQESPCGLYWWESTDDYGTTWSERVIDANFRALMPPYPADMDGDGDVDIITCEYDTSRIVWWQNTHSNGSSWKKHVLDEETDGRQLVYGADMDGDRDIDVVGATWLDGGVFWWENTNGRGTDWNKHTVDSNTEADYCRTHCLRVADMDGDGYLDVVASAGRESGINWWQNPGRGAEDWKRHYVVGSDGEVESVYPADIDGDGDADLIGSIRRHDGLTWWENMDRAGTDWTKHVIDSSYTGEQGVDVADIDRDGDLDIAASAQRTHSVIWWENTTGTATKWARHVMTKSFSDAFGAYGVDMDGDGDLDLLGAAHSGKEIAWFENQPAR